VGGSGIGVIGSSAKVLFDSAGCTSDCGVTGENCKPPSVSAQITIARRRPAVRALPISPEPGNCNKTFLTISSGSFGRRATILLPTLIPPSSPILRHNSVFVGCDDFADEQASSRVDDADSGDRIVDDISNHGSTSRPVRSVIGAERRHPVTSRHRVSSRPRWPF
jgi:hypothetical protein